MKLIHIVGCRPNFIKLAPVYRAAKDLEQIIIHTGQHYDYELSKIFFDELEIPEPDINLNVKESLHGLQTGRMLARTEHGLLRFVHEKPIVVVYGDTNSTLAGALAAKKLGISVIHVEALVRSHEPYLPEEINRKMVDAIADLNFSPRKTGDVMFDSFLWAQDKLEPPEDSGHILVTIHRENNTRPERFKQIEEAISKLEYYVYWPRHPRIKRCYNDQPPISYLTMLARIRDAKLVITDSGGLQKEAFWCQTPCITLRKKTEWYETLRTGWNVLCEPENLVETVKAVEKFKVPQVSNPYGDGKAAKRIVEALKKFRLDK